MTGYSDTQAELYKHWAAEVTPIINEILEGSRDRTENWVGMYNTGAVKGQLRVQRMDTGLFKLGFQGKLGTGRERRNAWDVTEAVAALDERLNGRVVNSEETDHWLVVDYDPRFTQELMPFPEFLQVAMAIEAAMAACYTNTSKQETLTYETDNHKVTVDFTVTPLGNTGDFLVEVTPRNVDIAIWNTFGLLDALDFYYGDHRVVEQASSEIMAAVTIYTEQHN